MKRFIVIFPVAVLALIGLLLVVPGFIDWTKYKDQMVAQLEQTTGLDYEIDGKLELALLPFPKVLIENLNVVAPNNADQPQILTLKQLEVDVELLPLLQGQLAVNHVNLINPVVHVVASDGGTMNFMTPELSLMMQGDDGKNSDGKAEEKSTISLKEIRIKGGEVTFSDLVKKQSFNLSDINLVIKADELVGPYTASGDVVYAGQKAELDVKTGRIDNLSESVALQLKFNFPKTQSVINYSGVIAYNGELEIQGETSIKSKDARAVMSLAGVDLPSTSSGSIDVRGILTMNGQQLSYQNLSLSYGDILSATGQMIINRATGNSVDDISIELDSDKPIYLDRLLSVQPESGSSKREAFLPNHLDLPIPFTAKANIKASEINFGGQAYKAVTLALNKDDIDMGGSIKAGLPEAAGSLVADFSIVYRNKKDLEGGAGVSLSNPVVKIDTAFDLQKTSFLKGFMPDELRLFPLDSVVGKSGGSFAGQVSLTPVMIGVKDATLKLMNKNHAFSGSYALRQNDKKDLLDITLAAEGVDLALWENAFKENSGGSAQKASQGGVGRKAVDFKTIIPKDLPIDLRGKFDFTDALYKDHVFEKIGLSASLIDGTFGVERFAFEDKEKSKITATAKVSDIEKMDGIDAKFDVTAENWQAFLSQIGADISSLPKDNGRGIFTGTLKGSATELNFNSKLTAMKAVLEANGVMVDFSQVEKTAVKFTYPSYIDLVRFYMPDFKGGAGIDKSINLSAVLDQDGTVYGVSDLSAVIGPAHFKGTGAIDLTGKKPSVQADLQFADLPISQMMGVKTKHSGMIKARPLRDKQSARDVRWSRNAIDTTWMHGFNLNLKAKGDAVSYGVWSMESPVMELLLDNGTLNVKALKGSIFGGTVDAGATIVSSDKARQPIKVAANIDLAEINLDQFVQNFTGASMLKTQGKVSLKSDVETSGLSPAALIFDLAGEGGVTGDNLVFYGFDLTKLSRALSQPTGGNIGRNFSTFLDAATAGGKTVFSRLESTYQIKEGVVNFTKLNLDGPDASINSFGNVNLPLWTIDLQNKIKLAKPEDAPVLGIDFKGPLDEPARSFGQKAMQSYLDRLIESSIKDVILNKVLDQKTGDTVVPGSDPAASGGGENNAPAPKQIKPEEALFNILENVIKN